MQFCGKVVVLLATVLVVPTTIAVPLQVDSGNEQHNVQQNHSQILIIGAGPSGVAAASRLMENGVMDVAILEAENRLGGRVHTVPFGDDVVDLGAQWVHGVVGNVVYEMAAPLGLLLENTDLSFSDNWQYLLGNGDVPDQDVVNHLMNISETIRDDNAGLGACNGSFGQFFLDKFAEKTGSSENNINADPSLKQTYLNWYEKVSAFYDGADSWLNLSCRGMLMYEECPGDQGVHWKNNGYYSVINLLTKRYPHPGQELPVRQKTHFNTEVTSIRWGPQGVERAGGKKAVLVEASNGARYTADIVIVTVSLGVLKERASTMFSPPLPSRKMNAVTHIGFGQVNKIFMHFSEAWWPTNVTGFSALVTDEDRRRFSALYPQYEDKGEWVNGLTGFYVVTRQPRSVLMDWLVGEPARNMENYSDYQVMVGCMRWLEMFAGRALPWPTSLTRSKWYSNPHFRGSYSHRSLDSETYDAQPAHLTEPLLAPDGTPVVLFAGEASSDRHFSTVHGAVETGWREADRVLNLLGKENRSRAAAQAA